MNEAATTGAGGKTNLILRVFGEESGARKALGLGVWLGAWGSGRLGRIGYVVAALVLYGLLGVIQWFILDAMQPEPIQLTPTYQPMSETQQLIATGASFALSILTLLIGLNIAAKRIRAIGAPGWGGAAALTVINGVALLAIPGVAYPWLPIVILIALMVLPNGLLKWNER